MLVTNSVADRFARVLVVRRVSVWHQAVPAYELELVSLMIALAQAFDRDSSSLSLHTYFTVYAFPSR